MKNNHQTEVINLKRKLTSWSNFEYKLDLRLPAVPRIPLTMFLVGLNRFSISVNISLYTEFSRESSSSRYDDGFCAAIWNWEYIVSLLRQIQFILDWQH